ncbi:hypothetical protein MRB53_032203 [Persea americana]|uniref:Uncharacterized protein n=1 Tax=Persea americana TaxID=3435 RepID=A0ACC2KRG8_PERAE|nr:hypothetical protein MRB53_032203 [Persea americana]
MRQSYQRTSDGTELVDGMGLWTLLEGLLLLANALAILNEDRFLAPRGWSFSEVSGGKTCKIAERTGHWPHLCSSILQSSPDSFQYHHCCSEVGVWLKFG